MRILQAQVGPLVAANANIIANSQSGTAGTALTLNTTTLTLDTPRRIIISCAGDEHAHTFTVNGTNWIGLPVTETITGNTAGNVSQSLWDYASITSVIPVSSTTSTVTVGTNGVASTVPLQLDQYQLAPTAIQVTVFGTANVTVQQTLDDLNVNPRLVSNSSYNGGFVNADWLNHADPNLVNVVANTQGNYSALPLWVRLYLNSSTATTGSAVIKLIQSGHVGR